MAIDEEPFEFGDLRDQPDRVGELVMGGQDRPKRAPGKLAVADLAAAGGPHAAGLADGVGREVVVQHERFFVRSLQGVDELLVVAGAERGNDQRLGFATGEQRRAVGARQQADLGEDRADRLEIAAVDARTLVEDVVAHDRLLELLEHVAEQLRGRRIRGALGRQIGRHAGLDRLDGVVTLGLGGKRVGIAQAGLGRGLDLGVERRIVRQVDRARLLGGALGELDDQVDHRLEALVAEHDGAEHVVLGKLAGLRFDHEHGVMGAGDDEIELRFDHLVDLRVEHEGAVDEANAGAADRAHEGRPGQRQRRGGGDHGDDIGIVLKVVRQHGGDDLGLAAEARREERADGTVDQAGGQRFLLGRPALTLEETTGDLAGGEGLLLVVDGEREEIDSRAFFLGGDDGGEDRGVAVGGEHGTISLTGDLAGFENEFATSPLGLDTMHVEHGFSFRATDTQGEP